MPSHLVVLLAMTQLYYIHWMDDVSLHVLTIPQDTYVPFDFSTGYAELDNNHIMIEKLGVSQNENVHLCESCHWSIIASHRPIEALSNYRWIGEQPEQLSDLTWLEELLIARAHLVGKIIRLEERKASSYFALKCHTILLPQDTTRLLDLLPMSLSSLPDIIRVVWAGKTSPEQSRLRTHFTVHTAKICKALQWLCRHHEDYRHVTIDEERIAAWNSTEVAVELMDSMTTIADPSVEDTSRSGFATEDPDTDEVDGDIPHTVSGFVDINNVTHSPDVSTLYRATQLRDDVHSTHDQDIMINVVTGNTILSEYYDPNYFTSAFPTLFPYGTGTPRQPMPKRVVLRTMDQIAIEAYIKV